MRCISIKKFGEPEVLQIDTTVPKPSPKEGQVLINVKAANVNPVDVYIRAGNLPGFGEPPFTPGFDGAGIVDEVGEGVTRVKKGDRVWFCETLTGAYAEYTVCLENNVHPLPESYSFEQGATLGIPYLSAQRSLFQKANLQKGETVLIHGGSGGVGTASIQICKAYGVRVIATAGSEDGIKILKDMGVDAVYNHRQQGYTDELKKNEPNIDVIIEVLANVNLEKDIDLINKTNGRIVVIGSRGRVEIDPMHLVFGETSVTGMLIFKSTPEQRRKEADFICQGLKDGWVKPVLWQVMDLEKASVAHTQIMENKGAKGQIVLKI